jgi:hypothetical protein
LFVIELTRGSTWERPAETVLTRECDTDSLTACAAEARHWLAQIRKDIPHVGVTHYRVIGAGAAILGGSL